MNIPSSNIVIFDYKNKIVSRDEFFKLDCIRLFTRTVDLVVNTSNVKIQTSNNDHVSWLFIESNVGMHTRSTRYESYLHVECCSCTRVSFSHV
jgi:hypothetical protein